MKDFISKETIEEVRELSEHDEKMRTSKEMNISEKIIDIIKGMEGIGGIPTDKEFLDEFEFRLQVLKTNKQ